MKLQSAAGALAAIGLGSVLLAPVPFWVHRDGRSTACESSEKNIATALEMYASDHLGAYPDSLKELTPNYLRVVPTCAGAGRDTYSTGYRAVNDGVGHWYSFCCSGWNHRTAGLPADRPRCTSRLGVLND